MSHLIKIFVIVIFINRLGFSQTLLPVTTNFIKGYNSGTRDSSGVPGKHYWQNSADYVLKVKFEPETRELKGVVKITYFNNSPDTLNQIVLKLFPNLFQAGSIRKIYISGEDVNEGVQVETIQLNNIENNEYEIRGTNMFIENLTILPGQKTDLEISYSYILNKNSFIRTGEVKPGAYVIAYFFPRIAVYDDIDGWDFYPYTGREEFYNDYGEFQVEISVPDDYQVWGTGKLINSEAVFNPKFINRIEKASSTNGVIDIITASDLKKGNITKKNKWNTWIFYTDNVSDFAFAVSDHYIWKSASVVVDSTSMRRTRVDAVYNPNHKSYDPVVKYAQTSVDIISNQFPGIPFPYPQITIFEGLDAMEYPMLINNLPFEGSDAIMFTMHEIFHTLFPFYVGTNETKYSFMDEGLATLTEFMMYPYFGSNIPLHYSIDDLNESAGSDQDVPIMTLTTQLYGEARFANKDLKPALGFLYIKEMVGDVSFNKALKLFISNWKGKHPTPYDFFNCLNFGTKQNLNWFWRNWFFEKNIPDLAIGEITQVQSTYSIVINKIGNAIVPVHLRVIYEDGTEQIITENISCWKTGNTSIILKFSSYIPIKKLVLGSEYDADINKENNIVNY